MKQTARQTINNKETNSSMSAKVSPKPLKNLYKDDSGGQPPPAVAHSKSVTEAASPRSQVDSVSTEQTSFSKMSNGEDTPITEDMKDEPAQPTPSHAEPKTKKLNFKNAAEQIRRNSTESIGDVSDLLNPSSAAVATDKDALDEPDFWDKMSQFSVRMRKDGRYFFQHPYARLIVAYLVTFCNFLIYAEDPVAHSSAECNIIAVGNIYSFVVTKYPPNGFSALKVLLWLLAIAIGLVVGKLVIHKILLKRVFKLQMFQDDMGSFMMMFLTSLICLFAMSWLYNAFLLPSGEDLEPYAINGLMNMKNSTFMKAAACGTWLGDFFTAWMVTDVMLQEKFYPEWARGARSWWNRGKNRIILFWCMALLATIIVIVVISTDWVRWDSINASFLATNELSRSFLASFILVMDLLIVMQDWDFPHFVNHFDIKLPGLNTANVKINIPQCLKRFERITIHITGKWFNYGIIFLVMILDLNMWKNQIFYAPADYAQCVDDKGFIYSYRSDDAFLKAEGGNLTSAHNTTYCDTSNVRMESKYLGYPLPIKAIAFIPSLAAFVAFTVLIIIYGRVKPTKTNPYVGRIVKKPKSSKTNVSMFTIVKMKLFRRKPDTESVALEETDGKITIKDEVHAQSSYRNSITV